MITLKQGAKLLQVSEVRLRQLLATGRVPGAHKFGWMWMLPDKPVIDPPLQMKHRRKPQRKKAATKVQ